MTKFVMTGVAALALALPAMAGTLTLSFQSDTGTPPLVVTIDEEGNATLEDGTVGTYTWVDESGTLCGTFGEVESCAVIGKTGEAVEVGATASFTADEGVSGTVTVVAMEDWS